MASSISKVFTNMRNFENYEYIYMPEMGISSTVRFLSREDKSGRNFLFEKQELRGNWWSEEAVKKKSFRRIIGAH
jgi:hypothetical protein